MAVLYEDEQTYFNASGEPVTSPGPVDGQPIYNEPVDGPVPGPVVGYAEPLPYDPTLQTAGSFPMQQFSNNVTAPGSPTGSPIPTDATFNPALTPVAGAVNEQDLSGVPIGPTDAVTREVGADELVANQMEGLLAGDSAYIRNARQRAAELSNRRGQFTSSLFAGAAERAAIESALPIAQADAQAYRDAATQNLAARNQNAIANIQRAAMLDQSLLSSRTQISLGNLDAATRVGIANMDTLARINIANLDSQTQRNIANMNNGTALLLQEMQGELEMTLQSRSLTHDAAMAEFNLNGQLQLAHLDAELRTALQQAGFTHDINMANLTGQQQLLLNTVIQEYGLEQQSRDQGFNERQNHINMAMGIQVQYAQNLAQGLGVEMDAAAAAAFQAQQDAWLMSSMQLINGLFPNQPAIQVQFEGGG